MVFFSNKFTKIHYSNDHSSGSTHSNYPVAKDSEINNIASKLSIDLSKTKNTKEKKQIFDNVTLDFKDNLTKIYENEKFFKKRDPSGDLSGDLSGDPSGDLSGDKTAFL